MASGPSARKLGLASRAEDDQAPAGVRRGIGGILFLLLLASVANATTVRFPTRGAPLFHVDLPQGWHPRAAASVEEIHADSPRRDAELVLRTIDTEPDDRRLDDAIARLADSSFTKVEFSNLHQRRIVNGRSFAVFRGSGRDRARGGKTSFEVFAFAAGGKTALLYFRYRVTSARTMDETHAVVESVGLSAE